MKKLQRITAHTDAVSRVPCEFYLADEADAYWRAQLDAMARARDAWRDEVQRVRSGHAINCMTTIDGVGTCNCPARFDKEATNA